MRLLLRNKTLLIFFVAPLTLVITFSLYKSLNEPSKTIIKKVTESKILSSLKEEVFPKTPIPYEYVQVIESCDTAFGGICVNVRSSPSITAPVIFKARTGLVLKVAEELKSEGRDWYKLSFKGEWLRYPDRIESDMYISAEYVTSFLDEGTKELLVTSPKTTKNILIDRSDQMLYAYDGEILFMKEKVSTGIKTTPTPRGWFTIFKKSPSRYMQGPIPGISDHYYDLPGVPWNLYFTEQGAVIHGAYWHNSFGKVWSNGCVNLPLKSAELLYKWADVGTKVLVRD